MTQGGRPPHIPTGFTGLVPAETTWILVGCLDAVLMSLLGQINSPGTWDMAINVANVFFPNIVSKEEKDSGTHP